MKNINLVFILSFLSLANIIYEFYSISRAKADISKYIGNFPKFSFFVLNEKSIDHLIHKMAHSLSHLKVHGALIIFNLTMIYFVMVYSDIKSELIEIINKKNLLFASQFLGFTTFETLVLLIQSATILSVELMAPFELFFHPNLFGKIIYFISIFLIIAPIIIRLNIYIEKRVGHTSPIMIAILKSVIISSVYPELEISLLKNRLENIDTVNYGLPASNLLFEVDQHDVLSYRVIRTVFRSVLVVRSKTKDFGEILSKNAGFVHYMLLHEKRLSVIESLLVPVSALLIFGIVFSLYSTRMHEKHKSATLSNGTVLLLLEELYSIILIPVILFCLNSVIWDSKHKLLDDAYLTDFNKQEIVRGIAIGDIYSDTKGLSILRFNTVSQNGIDLMKMDELLSR